MPVDVAMHNPRPRIIRPEANRDIVTSASQVHNVALDRIHKIRFGLPHCANDTECVAVEMHGVLEKNGRVRVVADIWICGLTGPPGDPPGMEISITLFGGRV